MFLKALIVLNEQLVPGVVFWQARPVYLLSISSVKNGALPQSR
jgi:hypothetical protein